MKKNELSDLRAKTPVEISSFVGKKKAELKKMWGEMAIGRHKNIRQAKNLRRDVAQALTVLSQKKGEGHLS
ncbi:MAG: 50S ribosomal protein L29 [Candidatus Blackburnbacteria bacterium]|nr:50S ribosomal protein L29 [Candidatus Blackburnbacteria bacterium]